MFKRLDFWLGCGYVFVLGFWGFGFSMAGCVCAVLAMVLVACVELWSSSHGDHGFDSEMERLGEERREREGRCLRLNHFCWKKKKKSWWHGRSRLAGIKHIFYANSWPIYSLIIIRIEKFNLELNQCLHFKHKYNNKITNITIRTRMLNLKMVLGDGWGPSWCVYFLHVEHHQSPTHLLVWCGNFLTKVEPKVWSWTRFQWR